MTTIIKRCPGCKKKVTVLWHQLQGMRLLREIKGKQYYDVKCPECGHEWEIRK